MLGVNMLLKLIFLFIFSPISFGEREILVEEKKFLTEHFFSNLKEDYQHVLNVVVNGTLATEIDNKIDGFLENIDRKSEAFSQNLLSSGESIRKARAISNLIRVDKDAGK